MASSPQLTGSPIRQGPDVERCGVLALVVLLAVSLAGCTGSGDPPVPPPSALAGAAASPAAGSPAGGSPAGGDPAPAQVQEGQDLGNGRPDVSYDGLMVRRRVVIAVHSEVNAELEGVRKKLEAAALTRKMALHAISPTVLEPAVLQHVMPELIVALPPSATLADGQAVVDRVVVDRVVADQAAGDGSAAVAAEHFHVLPVLVHDLNFTVESASPDAVSSGVDKEGILSDALGNYGTSVGNGQVVFSYTGPLLGDGTVESVRAGIARQARVAATAVGVTPRSRTGTGVDMAMEPPWDPEVVEERPGHAHG